MEDRLVAQYLPDSAPLRGVLQLVSPSAAIAGLAGFAGSAAHGAALSLPAIGAEYDVGEGPSRRAAAEATGQQLPPPPRRYARPDEDYEVRTPPRALHLLRLLTCALALTLGAA